MSQKRRLITGCAVFFSLVLVYSTCFAQFGLPIPGVDALKGGKKGATPEAAPASGGKKLASDTTFTNAARKYQYTVPAGWEIVQGDPTGEDVGFHKMGTTMSFTIHITQMTPSFPRKASVDASLKQEKERVQIKQLLEAKRRDDGANKKDCGVIGWQITEAPQKNDYQRIIWQCYDGQNYYMNFNASSENKNFEASRATLETIIQSIKFCQ